ncbi:solute carrier family 35 member F2 isoform X3 [Zonotrichia leucophrys gambelii]
MLSMFICGTAVTSQYLADRFNVNTPMLQSFINYCLLLLVYTTTLVFRTGSDSLCQILKQRWWKYLIVGLADVEANYTIVKAYQYTNLTSVQLLDCFGIPALMALSWFLLRARYKLIHFVAVAICLLGVATMVGADILAGREEGEGSDVVIGDVLVLLAASLYAISNVGEEYIVKNLSRVEFLGMVGLFGTIISGLQLAIVEHKEIMKIQWNWKIALLFTAFALCMFGLYNFMPVVIKITSATSVNLAILTSDLYSLFIGLYLFYYKVSTSCPFLSSWWASRCTAPLPLPRQSPRPCRSPATPAWTTRPSSWRRPTAKAQRWLCSPPGKKLRCSAPVKGMAALQNRDFFLIAKFPSILIQRTVLLPRRMSYCAGFNALDGLLRPDPQSVKLY